MERVYFLVCWVVGLWFGRESSKGRERGFVGECGFLIILFTVDCDCVGIFEEIRRIPDHADARHARTKLRFALK
jgi:hypothetical protein